MLFHLADSGELYSWGHGGYGQLGHTALDKSIPALVSLGDMKVVQVACGSYHSAALAANGEVLIYFYLSVSKFFIVIRLKV